MLYTHRDYVVTGDTIGTLDEVMHLSVFLIPRFKSLFTLCSLSPNTGTRTHRCSLSHALCTLTHFVTHTHTEAWVHFEVRKVTNAPSCLCVLRGLHSCISFFLTDVWIPHTSQQYVSGLFRNPGVWECEVPPERYHWGKYFYSYEVISTDLLTRTKLKKYKTVFLPSQCEVRCLVGLSAVIFWLPASQSVKWSLQNFLW